MEDVVTHNIPDSCIEWSHSLSFETLPHYYIRARKFRIQLQPLNEEERSALILVKRQAPGKKGEAKRKRREEAAQREQEAKKRKVVDESGTVHSEPADSEIEGMTTNEAGEQVVIRNGVIVPKEHWHNPHYGKKKSKRRKGADIGRAKNRHKRDKKKAEQALPSDTRAIDVPSEKQEEVDDKIERQGNYKKRVQLDALVDFDEFTAQYRSMKEKYSYWVKEWEEVTDPGKYVFEDIAIASYLICLWKMEEQMYHLPRKQSFVDVGAGNGFLAYLLTSEGYTGRGIDLQARKIWDKYPSSVRLEVAAIDTPTASYEEDWIVANHSDELTPWIPVMASRGKISDSPLAYQRYFVLPCCEFDFDRRFERKGTLSRYEAYLDYVALIGKKSGYKVEHDTLRIPSTRNNCMVGRGLLLTPKSEEEEVARRDSILKAQDELYTAAGFTQFIPRPVQGKSTNKSESSEGSNAKTATVTKQPETASETRS